MCKLSIVAVAGLLALIALPNLAAAAKAPKPAKGPQWRLAVQAYTFNRFTFFEAIDKAKSIGLKYIEAYPGQKLSKEKSDVRFDHNISPEIMKEVQQKLNDAGIKLVNYGVVDLGKDEASARKVFEFAKKMGIRTIVAEPDPAVFDALEKLTKEYKIRVAIHNHPKGPHSRYWDPQTVLDAVKNRSKMIGACADTGHWPRSGLSPLECLKKLEGRIISLHFKDLNELNKPEAHDVVWGTGKCDVPALLAELKRQNFRGVFSVEYEHNWENSVPEIKQCLEAFRKMAKELGVTCE